jgi:hypothetical protein
MPRPRRDGTPPQPPNRHKLTDLFVKRQKPRARAFIIWDTLQRGFALSVQPTGHKAYKVVYSHQGRVRWFHLGNAQAIGLSDARRLANRVMVQVAEGKDPQAERKAARPIRSTQGAGITAIEGPEPSKPSKPSHATGFEGFEGGERLGRSE